MVDEETRSPDPRRIAVALAALAVAASVVWLATRWLGAERVVAPRPAETADVEVLPELEPSSLTVPLRIRLGRLLGEVEAAVPASWGDLERRIQVPDNDRLEVAVALGRTPFRASFQGDRVRLATTVAYRLRAWYDPPLLPEVGASCGTGEGEAPPRLSTALESPLSLSREWDLSVESRVAWVTPASDRERDRCSVTFLGIDITDRVTSAARGFLESHRPLIDSVVAEADIRSSFQEWWGVLRDPIRLDEGVWLMLEPEGVRRGPVRGQGDLVMVTASLTARPRVVLGNRPVPTPTRLPPLEEGLPDNPGLRILVQGTAQYDAIGERLTERLEGMEIEAAGRSITLTGLSVTGIGGGRVALEVEVDGDVEGRLFLVGTPEYDPSSGLVAVPDLTLTVETSDVLVAGASWLADSNIERLLRERARWPVGPAVEWVSGMLHQGLNRELAPGVRLSGSVDEVRILGVAARKTGLVVRAAAVADAQLTVETQG